MILIADTIMQRFGAKRDMYTIRLNSRQLINHILQDYLGLDADTTSKTVRLIDRKSKMPDDTFKEALKEAAGDKTDQLLKILQVSSLQSLPDDIKQHPSYEELHHLEMTLTRSGITYAQFDITLMRGFDYYTDIVFEIYDTNPENNRSLFGGGRYDGLVGLFGVEPIPTVGFGMGDVTTHEFLQLHQLMPQSDTNVDLDVILIGDVYIAAQELLAKLRSSGLNVAVDSSGSKIDKQIKNAVKADYKRVLIIGEKELAEHLYNLKELSTGQEQRLTLEEVVETTKNKTIK
jgi:histidyl-tRNA synthetase